MSTYTTSLGLEEITPGDQAGLWGNTTNTNLTLLDQAIAGVTTVNLGSASGSTYVLTFYNGAYDESRSAVISVTGSATGSNIIQIPAAQKLYVFRNNSGNSIVVQTAAAANTVTLKNGEATLVFCDGFNAYAGIQTAGAGTVTVPYGGTGATSFSAGFVISPGGTGNLTTIATVPLAASSGAVSGTLPPANGGSGTSTAPTSGQIPIGTSTGVYTPATLTAGSGITITPSSGGITISTSSGSGITSVSGSSTVTASTAGTSVTVSQTSSQAIAALGFTPASLSSTNNFTGTNNYSTAATIQMASSASGTQQIQVTGSGYNSGMSPAGVQIGVSGWGLTADSTSGGISVVQGGTFATDFRSTGNFQSNNSASWATVSDVNLKTNLHPITNVLEKINALNPLHFEYKDTIGKTKTGFIAQEFETVFPGHTIEMDVPSKYKEFVPEGQETIKGLDLDLVPYLVKAIQELSKKVTDLEEQVLNLGVK